MAKIVFTAGLVAGFKCPPDKTQAFLWDAQLPGMGLRATRAGSAAFVFQSTHNARTLRLTIGSPQVWTITQARAKAGELARQIAAGRDPRGVNVGGVGTGVNRASTPCRLVTVDAAWAEYLLERRPSWSERHYRDHVEKAAPGGVPTARSGSCRSNGVGGVSGVGGVGDVRSAALTLPGPLASLLPLPLRDLDAATVAAWAKREVSKRPTSARLAWRLLAAFLGWCAEQPAFAALLPAANPARTKASAAVLGAPTRKSDALQREHLPAWFKAVRALPNPVVSAYLQTVLLTGARPGELLALRWTDLNPQSASLTLRNRTYRTLDNLTLNKTCELPLTPYVANLLTPLARRNEWVFAGQRGRIVARPNELHTRACTQAGLPALTLHSLRRSFKTLSEWLQVPPPVVAQLMGQPASGRDGRDGRGGGSPRHMALLHQHQVRIEAWILELAGVGPGLVAIEGVGTGD